MPLTTDFLNNPVAFMSNRAILIPNGVTPRNGRFEFTAQGDAAALLRSAPQQGVAGYYVHPVADSPNQYALPTQQAAPYFMFTDQMNGCQFIAYGPDRHHVTVEHNNYIGDPGNYAQQLAAVRADGPAYVFSLTAADANAADIAGGTYNRLQGVNVVGQYSPQAGWRFFVRDAAGHNRGQVYGPM